MKLGYTILPWRADATTQQTRSPRLFRRVMAMVILIHLAMLILLGLTHHWSFLTSVNDHGAFDQVVWNTLHGNLFISTVTPPNPTTGFDGRPINWLGIHFNPCLLLFVPLYALFPAAEWLTIAQAVALSLAAWPIFCLATRVLQSEGAALLIAIAYLFNPQLISAAAWDFHPVCLSVPLFAVAMLAIEKQDFRTLLICCMLLLTVQEHLGISVLGLGILWGLRFQRWWSALLLATLGVAYTVLVFQVVIPSLSPTHTHNMLSSGTGQVTRYSWLGNSLGDIVFNFLSHPLEVGKTIFIDLAGFQYIGWLMLLFAFLPLAAPAFMLPAMADLIANLLSAFSFPREWSSYHSVGMIPVLMVAATYGLRRVAETWKRYSVPQLSGLLLVTSVVTAYVNAPAPLPGAANHWAPAHRIYWPDAQLPAVRKIIGNATSVSAQSNVAPHFSQRVQLSFFPHCAHTCERVVLRLESPTDRLPPESVSLVRHLQMHPKAYLDAVREQLEDPAYGIAYWQLPWLVFARGAVTKLADRSGVEKRLLELQIEWRMMGK